MHEGYAEDAPRVHSDILSIAHGAEKHRRWMGTGRMRYLTAGSHLSPDMLGDLPYQAYLGNKSTFSVRVEFLAFLAPRSG